MADHRVHSLDMNVSMYELVLVFAGVYGCFLSCGFHTFSDPAQAKRQLG